MLLSHQQHIKKHNACESVVGKININREKQEWRVFVAGAERAVVRLDRADAVVMSHVCHT